MKNKLEKLKKKLINNKLEEIDYKTQIIKASNNHSSRIYLPKSWEGETVITIKL